MSTVHVQGRCPACHGDTLVLDGDHHVTCDTPGCPDPTAAAHLLEAPVANRNWLIEEFERAKERAAQVPPWARPVVTRPIQGTTAPP